jgi:hypothetical protein
MLQYIKFMPTKYLKSIFFLSFVAVMLLSPSSHLALGLEVTYPWFPGAPVGGPQAPPTSIVAGYDILVYFRYVFLFLVITSGIIGAISIVVAGFEILLNTASGNTSALGAAKEKIWSAIMGILLLATSIIILRTINIDLVTPTLSTSQSASLSDVYLVQGNPASFNNSNSKESPTSVPDTRSNTDTNRILPYTQLYYDCVDLLVWVYSQPNFRIDYNRNNSNSYNVRTHRIWCQESINLRQNGNEIRSYKIQYEDEGVYYYMTNNCTGISSAMPGPSPAQKLQDNIPWFDSRVTNDPNEDQTVRSMRIVNYDDNFRYGVVLKDQSDECSDPIINPGTGSNCIPVPMSTITLADNSTLDVDFDPWFAYVIKQDPNVARARNTGAALSGMNLQRKFLSKDNISTQYSIYEGFSGANGYNGTPDGLIRTGTPNNIPADRNRCVPQPANPPPFPPLVCLNNLEHFGNYYSVVYATDLNENKTCRLFDETTNISSNYIAREGKPPYKMFIIPKYISQ